MRTYIFQCRECKTRLETKDNFWFECSTHSIHDIRCFWHMVRRHGFNFLAPNWETWKYIIRIIITFTPLLMIDILFDILFIVTYPFWKIHEGLRW